MPGTTKNLLSISKFTQANSAIVEFLKYGFFVEDKHTKIVLLLRILKGRLYQLQFPFTVSKAIGFQTNLVSHFPLKSIENVNHFFGFSTNTVFNLELNKIVSMNEFSNYKSFVLHVNKTKIVLWHKRLGHYSKKIMKNVLNSMHIQTAFSNFPFCEDYHYGKHKQNHFSVSQSKASRVLELIHSDLWCLALIMSKEGFKYYFHFLDYYTRFTWVFPLKSAAKVGQVFKNFHRFVKKQFDQIIMSIQMDWGGEFRALVPYFQQNCINFRVFCPYTH